MRRGVLTLSIALTVVLALAWSGGFAQPAESVKVGAIQPLPGAVAASGNYIRVGAEIGRDWINGRGGVLGRKVELLIEDNKSDPKEAATAAEKLIVRDKVPVIVGAWGSSMTLAAMPKLEEYGVPMIVETSSAATITKRGNPWIFRTSPPTEMEALGLEQYLKALVNKKADFLAVNPDRGSSSSRPVPPPRGPITSSSSCRGSRRRCPTRSWRRHSSTSGRSAVIPSTA